MTVDFLTVNGKSDMRWKRRWKIFTFRRRSSGREEEGKLDFTRRC